MVDNLWRKVKKLIVVFTMISLMYINVMSVFVNLLIN